MKQREHLEKIIIGQICSFKHSFQEVANILSPNSFKSFIGAFPCEIYYNACASLYPTSPIDILTVCQTIKKQHTNLDYSGLVYAISEASHCAASPSNLKYHAFLLIEECFKEEFVKIISGIEKRTDNYLLKSALSDMYKAATSGHDIFNLVDKSIYYLRKIEFNTEADIIENYSYKITAKCEKIKHLSQVQALEDNLFRLWELSPKKKEEIQTKLIEISRIIISK